MDMDAVRRLIDELDVGVSKENAKVGIYRYGGGDNESAVMGTRNGYLRFGVELLKAGTAPARTTLPTTVDVDLNYLMDSDSTVYIDMFELVEHLPAKDVERTWGDLVVMYSLTGFFLIVIPILAVIGLVAIIRYLL